jgi:hypothetical protein
VSLDVDRLYGLLPAVYRLRDADCGEPLRALLAAFAQQFAALEENVEQLYDNQFIETCAEWVAPYIGDLIGYRPLHGVSPGIASPRAEVANTITMRRRKGTVLVLEELAHDVTDWPAHAVEFFERLATTQYMKHVRLYAPATLPVRDLRKMLQQGGAFDSVSHTADMRRPEGGSGRYNIPNVGLFLWRLKSLPLSSAPLTPDAGDASGRKFRVDPLGADLRLFRHAQTEGGIEHLAEPVNVPEALHVRELALAAHEGRLGDDYGLGASVVLLRTGGVTVPLAAILIADLRDILDAGGNVIGWNHEASIAAGTVALDPERGRVLLGNVSDGPLAASFHYAQAREIGGGEYERAPEGDDLAVQRAVSGGAALQPELDAISAGGRLLINDSLSYAPTPTFKVDDVLGTGAPGHTVVVAARNGARPLIAGGGDLTLAIGARGRLVLDGLVIVGGALRLAAAADDEPRELVLRDCTLVPGRTLQADRSPASPGAASMVVEHPFATVTLERCVIGALQIATGAQATIADSIVDAGSATNAAYAGDGGAPGAELRVTESTLVGTLATRVLRLGSNSLFVGRIVAERRQEGCVRFSFVTPDSITPRRYRCVPDDAHTGVQPHFTSLRYGDPGYAQLRRVTAASIREGASDGSEMGVMHALFQPQRETNLRIRLQEYLRIGLHAGIFYVT